MGTGCISTIVIGIASIITLFVIASCFQGFADTNSHISACVDAWIRDETLPTSYANDKKYAWQTWLEGGGCRTVGKRVCGTDITTWFDQSAWWDVG
jgi:hypothetical protein